LQRALLQAVADERSADCGVAKRDAVIAVRQRASRSGRRSPGSG